ncbi:peptidase inhibitor family I36 protein (plasmid) [Streptomyces sp. NBC_01450]|uniref:peptidase inhibitor family I36 protein n=1 Tax=Streptomyces sp. NBC_01450 TaxID=2903871 RepID=UPI002E33EC35|nr:peptidase inhibitor family I36 protein [Streptomyces sp. NBC_01450]
MGACLTLAACGSGAGDRPSAGLKKADGQVLENTDGGLLSSPLAVDQGGLGSTARPGTGTSPEPRPGSTAGPASGTSAEPGAGPTSKTSTEPGSGPTPVRGQQGGSSADPRSWPQGQECPPNSLCLFENADFTGRRLVIAVPSKVPALAQDYVDGAGFDKTASSVINTSMYGVNLWTQPEFHGYRYSLVEHSRVANLSSSGFNDLVSSVTMPGIGAD